MRLVVTELTCLNIIKPKVAFDEDIKFTKRCMQKIFKVRVSCSKFKHRVLFISLPNLPNNEFNNSHINRRYCCVSFIQMHELVIILNIIN